MHQQNRREDEDEEKGRETHRKTEKQNGSQAASQKLGQNRGHMAIVVHLFSLAHMHFASVIQSLAFVSDGTFFWSVQQYGNGSWLASMGPEARWCLHLTQG